MRSACSSARADGLRPARIPPDAAQEEIQSTAGSPHPSPPSGARREKAKAQADIRAPRLLHRKRVRRLACVRLKLALKGHGPPAGGGNEGATGLLTPRAYTPAAAVGSGTRGGSA